MTCSKSSQNYATKYTVYISNKKGATYKHKHSSLQLSHYNNISRKENDFLIKYYATIEGRSKQEITSLEHNYAE